MSHRSRRTHLLLLLVAVSFIYLLFFSSEASPAVSFRTRTEAAMGRPRHSPLRGELSDEALQAQTNARLRQILIKYGDADHGDGGGSRGGSSPGSHTPPAPPGSGRKIQAGTGADTDPDDADEEISVAGRTSMPKAGKSESKSKPRPKGKSPNDDDDSAAPSTRKQKQQEQEKQQQQQEQQAALREINKPKYPITSDNGAGGANDVADSKSNNPLAAVPASSSDPAEIAAREELQSILTRAPMIIFSKSYCPYSRRAKEILLHEYDIVPKPYVVELDQMTDPLPTADEIDDDDENEDYDDDDDYTSTSTSKSKSKTTTSTTKKEKGKSASASTSKSKQTKGSSSSSSSPPPLMGKKIQDLLKTLTGRATVPNIMIASQSLGGSDEVVDLHNQGLLAERIRKMAGQRIVSIELVGADKNGKKTTTTTTTDKPKTKRGDYSNNNNNNNEAISSRRRRL